MRRWASAEWTSFWKSILDFYTCTECGRCSDHCPATKTGKKLSPKITWTCGISYTSTRSALLENACRRRKRAVAERQRRRPPPT